ncbi:MAG TPA: hypothetical protein VGF55_10195 [Gemmataceae bacterium]|jgi:hypothetical protein
MTAGKNRVRLGVEHLEDRCTPSATGSGLAALSPARHGGPHAAAALVRAAHGDVVPIRVAFQCSVDLNSLTVSSTGSSTSFGKGGPDHWTWTALGHADTVVIDLARDRGTYSGTGTLVTAAGDQLFYSFTTSWRLSTGKGTHSLTATGGTGRFAGASGGGRAVCTITADPASPSTFHCQSEGSGILILPHSQHDATSRAR